MTDTPDFDNMTPEQIMAWMETLAKRQGAEQGFTTSADMEIAEVDESQVDASVLEQEYIPYGWKKEDWHAHLEKERAAKASAAPPPTPPAPVVPPPAPEPSAPAPVASGTLDVDNMTPEQLMAWMESLAKRQGAEQGFTTSADMEIAEVDASQVDASILEQEYVPYGWKKEDWHAHLEKERAAKAQSQLKPPAVVSDDDAQEETLDLGDVLAAPSLDDLFSSAPVSAEEFETFALEEEDTVPAVATDPLSWLSSLAGEDESQALDLGNLGDELEQFGGAVASEDPLGWLAGLAVADDAPPPDLSLAVGGLGDFGAPSADPIGGADPLAWLETLASEEGADPAQLMTRADVPLPPAPASTNDAPGYQPYSFEEASDPLQVMETLNAGKDVAPEDIANFFDQMFKRAEEIDDDDLALSDDDLPPVEAEIPDWLREGMMQATEETPAVVATSEAQLLADLGFDGDDEPAFEGEGLDFTLDTADDALPVANAIPDWLTSDDEGDTQGMSDIFVEDEPAPASAPAPKIDLTDPWVMALTTEAENQAELEAWYKRQAEQLSSGALHDAPLPEEADLPHGEPVDVPSWLVGEVEDAEQYVLEAPSLDVEELPDWLDDGAPSGEAMPDWLRVDDSAPAADLPDWLAGADVDIATDDIPDWLRETMDEEKPTPSIDVTPFAPAPAVVPAPTPKPTTPAPRPKVDAVAALSTARERLQQADIEASLQAYEAVVRANTSLPEVVSDLSKLLADKAHKSNPAVYRVLGDALMRQGNLQEALNTYRKALNLL
jgi:tetratricopeptide (TPR) repeat protein